MNAKELNVASVKMSEAIDKKEDLSEELSAAEQACNAKIKLMQLQLQMLKTKEQQVKLEEQVQKC